MRFFLPTRTASKKGFLQLLRKHKATKLVDIDDMTTQELGLQQNNFIDCFSLKASELSFTRKRPSLKPETTSETEATVTVYHIDEMKISFYNKKIAFT